MSPQETGGWAGTVFDAMKMDPSFWPECNVCPRPATKHHTEHAGTGDDGPVITDTVYCDEHSAERANHTRTRSVGPLTRPTDDEQVPE